MKGEREKKPPAGFGWPIGGRAVCPTPGLAGWFGCIVRSIGRAVPGAVLVLGGALKVRLPRLPAPPPPPGRASAKAGASARAAAAMAAIRKPGRRMGGVSPT
ncbi:hypothetical protein GCM10011504_08190 [Siccirubricoccus deserti]|nr:hypothetical protein GCM10011504_08190 [Siccirubricoccus deserti]